jgi:hypothetical protein
MSRTRGSRPAWRPALRPALWPAAAAVAAAALLLATGGQPARAFTRQTFRNSFGTPTHLYWPPDAFPVKYVLNSAGTPDIPGTGEFTALRNGFQHWDDVTTSTVSFQDNGTSASGVLGNDGVNRMVFVTNDPDMHGTAIIALTLDTYNAIDGRILDADIKYNEDFTFDASGTPPGGTIDLEAVATHESGHLLGLDHSFLTAATMYPFYAFPQRTLDPDDIAGVSSIYPDPTFYSTTGRIRGSVRTLITDRPLYGINAVAVSALGQVDIASALSEDTGEFVLPGLLPGSYYVRIQPVNKANLGPYFQGAFVDFTPVYYNNAAGIPQATAVSVPAGGEAANISFLLPDRVPLVRFDGVAETNIFFTNPAGANDWFAVRFNANLLPESFQLDSFTFVNGGGAVNGYRLLVTPDTSGKPNLASPFADVTGVNATASQTKSVALGGIAVQQRQTLWLVIKYPQGQFASLGVDTDGIDSTPVFGLTGDSFASGDGTNWQTLTLSSALVNLGFTLTIVPITPPPKPQVSSLSPATLSRGQTATFTVTGQNLLTGLNASVSGTGVTVNSLTWQSNSSVQLSLTAAAGAATGPRDLTLNSPNGTTVLARSLLTVLPAISTTEILAVENTPALGGTTGVLVGVRLTNTLPIGGFSFRLAFNPVRLTPVLSTPPQGVANPTTRTAGFELLGATQISPGVLLCTGIADLVGGSVSSALPAGTGTVVKLSFAVAPEDSLLTFPITLTAANLSDATGATLVLPTLQAGSLQLKDWILGDLNLDSLPYTIADALTSVSALMGTLTLQSRQLLASDVNDDGVQNNVADTVFLVNVLLGLEVPLGKGLGPQEPPPGAPPVAAPPELASPSGFASAPVTLAARVLDAGTLAIDADLPVQVGGILLRLALSPGAHVTGVEAPGARDGGLAGELPVRWSQQGAAATVLLLGLSGERLGPGMGTLARVHVEGGQARLLSAEAANGQGRTLATTLSDTPALPRAVALSKPVPNPFNPLTTLWLELPARGRARLALVDARGRQVAVLVDEVLPAGRHRVEWRGQDAQGRVVASGVYYALLDANGTRVTRKLALVR